MNKPLNPSSPKQPWYQGLHYFIGGGLVVSLIIVFVFINVRPTPSNPEQSVHNYIEELRLNQEDPEMVWIEGGTYERGTKEVIPNRDDEFGHHQVTVKGFWMDRTEITNRQFAKFVRETGYVTVSERQPDPERYPTARPDLLKPGSAVYVPADVQPWDFENRPGFVPPWWKYQVGASWKHPEGPNSDIKDKLDYPVVHITWEDATAYARWAKKYLPTEAEWEWAARGGLVNQPYTWGSDPQGSNGQYFANTFQGRFPAVDLGEDGFKGLAPVAQFPPNGYGLFDMAGNAWEWCRDVYDSKYYQHCPKDNPQGPSDGDRDRDDGSMQRVRRGGSFLCADEYCKRYIPAARDKNPIDASAIHNGFRCIRYER